MTRRLRIDDLTKIAVPAQPAVSPDGAQIAYVLRTIDVDADKAVRSLWRIGVNSGLTQRLTYGPADSSPAWAPDGARLAYLRATDGPPQLWLLPSYGGESEQLTNLPGGAGTPRWSPDGTRIAFVALVDEEGSGPLVADRLDYQVDGAGLLGPRRRHVHVVEVAGGSCVQVTEGPWNAGEVAWSPDGTRLAFAAAMAEDADLSMLSGVYVLDLREKGAVPSPVGLLDGVAGPLTWTADGTALLVVGKRHGPVGPAGLLRLPLDGGAIVDLAAPLDRTVMPGSAGYPGDLPQLVDDGQTVLFCVRDRGCTHLYAVGSNGGRPRLVSGGEGRIVAGLSVAGGIAAIVLVTPTSFGEITMLDLDAHTQTVRTEHGVALADVELYERVPREFRISDGTVVAGWLMRDDTAPGPQPLLLDIHGGPHNAWNGAADQVHLYHQELVARGWSVLLLNPRGSDGYGERFYNAALGGWGEADVKDFLEPLDTLVAQRLADPGRLAVAGYSYGGFMTSYLTSRDGRFAAAVAGGVMSDLTSMAGTSDAGHFIGAFELDALPWKARERLMALSPYAQVDKVTTPTLLLHGTADLRCPVGQAQQWHTALRERGVPTRLVLYPEASHLFIHEGRPSHRMDFNRRIASWLEEYAGEVPRARRPAIDTAHWQRRLSVLADRHRVPGATLGILRIGRADELVESSYGVLNKRTGATTTADSVFQIGSITKVWTATLVMQLVEEGRLDLDAPIVDVLPELRLANPDVTAKVTMRHLLTHTSGIDGDIFTDTSRGDDCVERYVAQLDEAAQNHPLGATWSYCNSGFNLAGRVIEKLAGGTWDQALRDRIVKPLGLSHTMTLPEEVLLHRAAVGHDVGGDGEASPVSVWGLPRAVGPAGLICSTVADVLGFARLHLTGGLAPDGERLLSQESVRTMADKHADLPDTHSLGDSWGLGWTRYDWNGSRVIGHDGGTIGQASFLRLLPDAGLAVALLTNGGNARDLYDDLFREIFAELSDVEVPRPPAPPSNPATVDARHHVGRYERAGSRLDVFTQGSEVVLRVTNSGPLAELTPEPVQEFAMTPVDASGDLFVVRRPPARTWTPVTFFELPTGERYVHFEGRASAKVG